MEKVQVRVIGKAFRRTAPGGVLTLSRRDARILESLGRVEYVSAESLPTWAYATDRRPQAEADAEVEFTASDRLDSALATPEAPLENVAHTGKPKRTRKAAKPKAEKAAPKKRRTRKKAE